jgi:hypothetical protein
MFTHHVADHAGSEDVIAPLCVSPLMLADRLLSLAQDADRAGFFKPAERLLKLAYAVCDEKPFVLAH